VTEAEVPREEGAPELGLSEEVFTEEAEGIPPEEREADEVATETPGPGDSEGGYPASPDEEEPA
jgi:hypothetical protein